MYDFIEPVQSNVQKWTAEMWAQLYNFVKFGWDVRISDELSFCRPTDPIEDYQKVKILHNAGVTAALSTSLFYKGGHIQASPFGKDFSWVDKQKASWHYTEAIKAAYTYIV